MLFPDMAIDINSSPATTQNVSLPLPSSAQSLLELGRPCEGRSSIKRAARMLASGAFRRSSVRHLTQIDAGNVTTTFYNMTFYQPAGCGIRLAFHLQQPTLTSDTSRRLML